MSTSSRNHLSDIRLWAAVSVLQLDSSGQMSHFLDCEGCEMDRFLAWSDRLQGKPMKDLLQSGECRAESFDAFSCAFESSTCFGLELCLFGPSDDAYGLCISDDETAPFEAPCLHCPSSRLALALAELYVLLISLMLMLHKLYLLMLTYINSY